MEVATLSVRERFEFWCLMPLAGFAIFYIRWWSYPVVIVATMWMATSNLATWRHNPLAVPSWIIVLMLVLDLALIGYLLLPQVRLTYFNPRVRWWETQPRYAIKTSATIQRGDERFDCTIENLSTGGCYIFMKSALALNDTVNVSFPLYSAQFSLVAEVVRESTGSKTGYGLRFVHTHETMVQMNRLCKALDMLKLDRNPPYVSGIQSYLEWLKIVFTQGKGLVPEIPESFLKK